MTSTEPKKVFLRQAGAAPPSRALAEVWHNRIFAALLAVIAAAPAPLGSAWPLAWQTLGLAVGALVIAFLIAGAAREPLPRAVLAPALLFALVLVYALLQSLPLGSAWAHPLWEIASEGLQRPLGGAIAVDPVLARDDLFRLLAYAGIFLLAYVLGRDRNRAHRSLTVFAFAASIYAVYGLAVFATGNTSILWFAKSAFRSDLTSTFVNPDTCAIYLGLGLLAAITDLVGALEPLRLVGPKEVALRKLAPFAATRRWQLAALVVLASALLLTHSRIGLTATLIGAVALLVAIRAAPSLQSVRFTAWVAIPLALVLIALLVEGHVGGAKAPDLVASTWQAVKDFVWLGTGLGSFAELFQVYRPETIAMAVALPPDEYLQNLLELGVPAALCLFVVVAWLAALCVGGLWWRNRDAIFPAQGLAATVMLAAQAFFGIGLQVPAVAASYLLLLGVAVAQSRSSTSG